MSNDLVSNNVEEFVAYAETVFQTNFPETPLDECKPVFKSKAQQAAKLEVEDVHNNIWQDYEGADDLSSYLKRTFDVVGSEDNSDGSGHGVKTLKAFRRNDVIFQDEALLKYPHEEIWDLEACKKWFFALNSSEMKQVLRLKRKPNFDKEQSAQDEKVAAEENKEEKKQETGEELLSADFSEALVDHFLQKLVADDIEDLPNALEDSSQETRDLVVQAAYGVVRTNAIRDDDCFLLYPFLSRVNHSCLPNLWQQNGIVVALRDIEEGEELCWCYPQGKVLEEWTENAKHYMFMNRDDRRSYMRQFYEFDCCCSRCKKEEADSCDFTAIYAKRAQVYFQRFTTFVEKSCQEGIDSDQEWRDAIETIMSLDNNMAQGDLHLDFRLLGQVQTVLTFLESQRLTILDGSADDRNTIQGVVTEFLKEVKLSVLGYGLDSPNVKDLQTKLEGLFYGRMLLQYAARRN